MRLYTLQDTGYKYKRERWAWPKLQANKYMKSLKLYFDKKRERSNKMKNSFVLFLHLENVDTSKVPPSRKKKIIFVEIRKVSERRRNFH